MFLKQVQTGPPAVSQGPRDQHSVSAGMCTPWSLTGLSAISFPSRTTQYSLSFLLGYDYRSFTALVGCGQGSAWREYNYPLLHSQTIPLWIHPWIISLSFKSISSTCFTDISHSNMSLKSFLPNQAPFQLHAQARHLGGDLTTSPNHPQILVLSPNIPGIHFLPPVIPVSSPTSLCLSPAPTSLTRLQTDLTTLLHP